jgi:hypothetical protein
MPTPPQPLTSVTTPAYHTHTHTHTRTAPTRHTPECNYLTAAPELFYSFTLKAGTNVSFDIRTYGYDTVLQLYNGTCTSPLVADIHCNDDGTPPGDLGSRIFGTLYGTDSDVV